MVDSHNAVPHDMRLEILKEALRHTEMRIDASVTLATSADQRAIQFSGMCIAISTLLITLGKQETQIITQIGGLCQIISAAIAAYSCRPQSFHVAGHKYEDWKGHLEDKDQLADVIESQCEENDERIKFNENRLGNAGVLMRFALLISFGSLALIIALLIAATANAIQLE